MLVKRIIPCLDIAEGKVVKGIKFKQLRIAADPVKAAATYDKEGADELVFLDITASHQKRKILIDLVRQVADVILIPFTVGGGINSIECIEELLSNGADKVSINTQAVRQPEIITAAAKRFGSQCIVVAIDAKRNNSSWEVYIEGGRIATGIDALLWAYEVMDRGAGELLVTSIDRDGTKQGYDLELLHQIREKVKIPLIASGGAGTLKHFEEVLSVADAALAASLFHWGEYSIKKIKEYLKKKGVNVRL